MGFSLVNFFNVFLNSILFSFLFLISIDIPSLTKVDLPNAFEFAMSSTQRITETEDQV